MIMIFAWIFAASIVFVFRMGRLALYLVMIASLLFMHLGILHNLNTTIKYENYLVSLDGQVTFFGLVVYIFFFTFVIFFAYDRGRGIKKNRK